MAKVTREERDQQLVERVRQAGRRRKAVPPPKQTDLRYVRMDEWIGVKVRLTQDVETRGGLQLAKGTEMYVTSHHRGRLTLSLKPWGATAVRSVNRYHAVEIVR